MPSNRFFDNPFEFLRRFGRNKVQIFIFLHIQMMKMMVVTKAYLAILITDTEALYNIMFGKTKDRATKTGKRIAETKEVATALLNFKKAMRKLHARAFDKLGVDSPIYIELFSNGLSFYNHMILENAYLVIATVKDAVTTYETELGADMKTLIDDCYTEFNRVRVLQTGYSSSVKANKPSYDATLDLMIKQLDKNRLTIALTDNTNPEDNYIYFEETVLFTPSHHESAEKSNVTYVSIEPDSQIDTLVAYGEGQTVTIENPSDFPAEYWPAQTSTETIPPSCLTVPEHGKVVLLPPQTGSPVNKYLLAGNKNLTNIIVLKITVE